MPTPTLHCVENFLKIFKHIPLPFPHFRNSYATPKPTTTKSLRMTIELPCLLLRGPFSWSFTTLNASELNDKLHANKHQFWWKPSAMGARVGKGK